MIPKFHWLLHFWRHLQSFGTLLSCFVHERKHRMVKRYANDVTNTDEYERTVLNEVICTHLAQMADDETFNFTIGLVRPRAAPRVLRDFLTRSVGASDADELEIRTAHESRFSPLATCTKNDVVLVRSGSSFVAGQVWAHAEIDGVCVTLVSLWELLHVNADRGDAEWRLQDNPLMIDTTDIIDTVIWMQLGDNVVRTLLPCHLR